MTTAPGKSTSQMEVAYQALRAAILGVELRPGDSISERWLETRVGASRTPIRTAIAKLEAEGLVQRRGRGYIVSPIDVEEVEQAYAFRETIEMAAVRMAAANPSVLDWTAVDALAAPSPTMSGEEWFEVGIAFHVELVRLSGNQFFVRAIADAMTRLSRGRWLEIGATGGRERAFLEHARVVELVRAGDGEAAAAAIREHVHHSRDRLLKVLNTDQRGLSVRGFSVINGGSRIADPANPATGLLRNP